jgi:hypothetical protein
MASAELCEVYGAALLGMPEEAFHQELCRLAALAGL